MEEISSCCMDRLKGYVKREVHRRGMTHYASRLVNDDKFPFGVMMDDFHWFSGDGGFMPVYDIPSQKLSLTGNVVARKIPNSIRSPFRIMVSGLAISPLMVVTPDSRAYLWTGNVGDTPDKNLRDLHSSLSIGPGTLLTQPPTFLDLTIGLLPWWYKGTSTG